MTASTCVVLLNLLLIGCPAAPQFGPLPALPDEGNEPEAVVTLDGVVHDFSHSYGRWPNLQKRLEAIESIAIEGLKTYVKDHLHDVPEEYYITHYYANDDPQIYDFNVHIDFEKNNTNFKSSCNMGAYYANDHPSVEKFTCYPGGGGWTTKAPQ